VAGFGLIVWFELTKWADKTASVFGFHFYTHFEVALVQAIRTFCSAAIGAFQLDRVAASNVCEWP
jgi:hypothetical protein